MMTHYSLAGNENIRRILIIKWSALGDLVISSALFEDLRQAFPDASIDLNTSPPYVSLFNDDPRFDEVFAFDIRKKGFKGLLNTLALVRKIRRERYDLVADLQANDRSRTMLSLLVLTGARIPIRMCHHDKFPYNIVPLEKSSAVLHSYTRHRMALDAAGIESSRDRPLLYVPEDRVAYAEQLLNEEGLSGQSYAIFMPGCQADGYLKRWGSGNYADLARWLFNEKNLHTVLIGARDDLDECRKIEEACDAGWLHNLCGKTQILDLIPLCEESELIVSNDTGTAHIASCTLTPMFVICGPTDPRRVKPLGDQVKAIQANVECLNCYQKECTHSSYHHCMKSVSVEMLIGEIGKMDLHAPETTDVS